MSDGLRKAVITNDSGDVLFNPFRDDCTIKGAIVAHEHGWQFTAVDDRTGVEREIHIPKWANATKPEIDE